MENLSNTYYLFRFIIEEIFVYIRDIILNEFGWQLGTNYDNTENHENRIRQTIFTHPVADFTALFIICISLGICVLFFSKPNKEEEEDYMLVDDSSRVNLPEDRPYKLPPTLKKGSSFRAASGDACSDDVGEGFIPIYAEEPEVGPPTASYYYNVHQAHSQSTQTTNRGLRRAAAAGEWLIRRTRSGHVYGKYPM